MTPRRPSMTVHDARARIEARRRRLDEIYRKVNDALFVLLAILFLAFVVGLGVKVAPVL